MKFAVIKLVVSSLLLFCSTSLKAMIINTGGLHYDTDTQVITGDKGLSYLGWGVAASLNYEQTLAATQSGGLYAGYHIAREFEARDFFLQSTGSSDAYTNMPISDSAGRSRFGNNNLADELVGAASTAFFLIDYPGISYVGVGLMLSSANSFEYYLDEIEIGTSDEYSASGSSPNSLISWLLVSDAETAVPEPGSISLFVLGLLGITLARKQQKQA